MWRPWERFRISLFLRHKAVKEWCELTVVFKIITLAAMDEPVCKRDMLDSDQETTAMIQAKTRVR